ncbi:MAG: hypothetical protein J5J00_06375 [Deltaproteobacteria bacterium]|nr:hypothetical protein [Deltaproteobacteria bacterium]
MRPLSLAYFICASAASYPLAAFACPFCHSETAATVRAEIFGGDFLSNLLIAFLPFGVIAILVGVFHYGLSKLYASQRRRPFVPQGDIYGE